jgi:hypothetical protein
VELGGSISNYVTGRGKMASAIQISRVLWEKMQEIIETTLKQGDLKKPIVFALYTQEHNHCEVIDFKEIPTVKVIGDYSSGEYRYIYPGIKAMGFYPPKGAGKWFSGTLVVGDSVELEEEDKKWMIREQLDFRIKMDRNNVGEWSCKTYFVDFPAVSLDLV